MLQYSTLTIRDVAANVAGRRERFKKKSWLRKSLFFETKELGLDLIKQPKTTQPIHKQRVSSIYSSKRACWSFSIAIHCAFFCHCYEKNIFRILYLIQMANAWFEIGLYRSPFHLFYLPWQRRSKGIRFQRRKKRKSLVKMKIEDISMVEVK